MIEKRFSPVEYRADTGEVFGSGIVYGDRAKVVTPNGVYMETVRPGAFGRIGDVILNLQHDRARPLARTGGGGLDITDGTDRLTVRAMLPDTTDGHDARALLRHDGQGVLRGFSVEMKVEADEIDPGARLRTIHRAKLHGLGLVDRPAYEQSTAILKRFQDMESRASFDGYYEYDGVETIGDTGADRKRQVSPGAFRGSIDDQAQEITLSVGRNPQEAIASKLAGTLILRDTATRLEIEAPTPAATDALRNLQAKRAAGCRYSLSRYSETWTADSRMYRNRGTLA